MDSVRELAASIAELAATVEADRGLPAGLVHQLKQAGVFRMYVPRSHGGDELAPIDVIRVIEEISRADASVGWLATIGANTPAIFAFLPPETYDKIYADGPDMIQAGSLVPRGRAVASEGGFRFTGQWPFASGCNHADYIDFASFIDRPGDDGGSREFRFGVVPRGAVQIVDTWHVSGLKGTGSHDIRVTDVFVRRSGRARSTARRSVSWRRSLRRDPCQLLRHSLIRSMRRGGGSTSESRSTAAPLSDCSVSAVVVPAGVARVAIVARIGFALVSVSGVATFLGRIGERGCCHT